MWSQGSCTSYMVASCPPSKCSKRTRQTLSGPSALSLGSHTGHFKHIPFAMGQSRFKGGNQHRLSMQGMIPSGCRTASGTWDIVSVFFGTCSLPWPVWTLIRVKSDEVCPSIPAALVPCLPPVCCPYPQILPSLRFYLVLLTFPGTLPLTELASFVSHSLLSPLHDWRQHFVVERAVNWKVTGQCVHQWAGLS